MTLLPGTGDGQGRLADLLGARRDDQGVVPEDEHAWQRMIVAIARREPFRDVCWQRQLPGGPILRVRESGRPRRDPAGRFLGYQGTIEEIGARRVDPARTRLATQVLAALQVPAALLFRPTTADEHGSIAWRLIWANAAMCASARRHHAELTTIDPHRWILAAPPKTHAVHGDSQRPQHAALARILDAAEAHRGPGMLLDRFGHRVKVDLAVEPLDHDGAGTLMLICADAIAPDLEALKAQASATEEARRSEARRSLELEVTARELESFSHTVSHDLRHPVRVIDGFARILQEEYAPILDRGGLDHLNRILAATHRMNAMIDALLELHRLSARPVVPDPVDLSALARAIVAEIEASDPTRRVQWTIEEGLSCRGDRVLLRMVLWNLLENAWKYSARRPDARIRFDSTTVHDSLVFRVSDNGAGFDMQVAERLFDLFHRLHSSRDFKGNGIGLATVQRIVRRHGGRIWAEAEPGRGACFQFTLWDSPG